MSLALISVALPMLTFGSGIGMIVGSLFLEKANLLHSKTIIRRTEQCIYTQCIYTQQLLVATV